MPGREWQDLESGVRMTVSRKSFDRSSRPLLMAASLAFVAIVGLVDYLTGFELYFFAFYLIPVLLAAWYIGRGFGIFVAVLCVAASLTGDVIAGARYSSKFVPAWNALIALVFYSTVIWILMKLRALYFQLEKRVRERTAALDSEMQERMRLEEEILSISEREQLRIGHDLHDSLCQHLTGIALAGQVLSGELTQAPSQSRAANHIVEMVEDAIELTRRLARGIHPVELKGEGLMDALRELAANISERFKTPCVFQCDAPVLIAEPEIGIHFYRIAQEATANALKHSGAKKIVIRLETAESVVKLTIWDDGIGLPQDGRKGNGMGLRIMAYRAGMIGAIFGIDNPPSGGTRVTCLLEISR